MKAKTLLYQCVLSGLFLLLSLTITTLAAKGLALDFAVKGTVSGETGPLPGVTIVEKGTSNGTTSDASGNFQLNVSGPDAVLVFSFIGYATKEVPVSGQSTIQVTLEAGAKQLSDVVITALGIKRSERALGYSVGTVSGEDLTKVNHENFLTALAGRVPGVEVNSTSGVGSSVSVIIRGATSLNGDNQPLYVVDGVPISSGLNNISEVGDRNVVDYGNVISDINPNDIASISVLKGPSAAALYGTRAGNGVILITTKKGNKTKGLGVSVNSTTVFDLPYKYLPLRKSLFASGERPYTPDNHPGNVLTINEGSAAWVGPELDKGYKAVQWNSPLDANGDPVPIPLVSHPDNWSNFFRTGITSTNNVAVSDVKEDISYRLSYTNMSHRGIIPNSDLFRNNLTAVSSYHLTKNFVISANINFAKTHSNNRPPGNRGTNPITALAYLNPSVDIMDLRDYWEPDKEGIQQRSNADGADNPWFLAYEAINSFTRNHLFGNVKAEWQITPKINLMARYSLNQTDEQRETQIAKSYSRAPNGVYGIFKLSGYERNADFLASYKNAFSDFDLNASIGGNLLYSKNTWFGNSTNNAGMVIPGLFNIGNVLPTSLNYSNSWSQRAIYSLYGLASLGYKRMVYLDITGRNDWSSTLPEDNRSYFYPSVSLSVLLDQVFHLPSSVSMVKIRGGIAQAGKDTGPYRLYPTLGNAGAWGDNTRLSVPGTLFNSELKPEIKTSYEFGTDLAFMDNRLRLKATYYQSDNKNQILSVSLPNSTGYESKLINAGLVRSKGVEFLLGITPTPASSSWQWDVNINFSRNRTSIIELTPEMKAQNKPFILWQDAKGGAWTYVGGQIGDIYDRQMVKVTDEKSPYYGYPILDADGSWQDFGGDPKNAVKAGNFNPKFTMGLQTSVSFKGFTLSATVDWRNGGEFYSETYRYTESDLHSNRFLNETIKYSGPPEDLPQYLKSHANQFITDGINIVGGPTQELGGFEHTEGGITLHDGVFNPGVIEVTDDQGNFIKYKENLGGPGTQYIRYQDNYPWSFSRAAMFDASFIKLREVSLSYAFPNRLVESLHLQNASLSVFSRNIILWTKANIGIDPEHAFEPSSSGFEQGIEHYNAAPFLMPLGIKLSLQF